MLIYLPLRCSGIRRAVLNGVFSVTSQWKADLNDYCYLSWTIAVNRYAHSNYESNDIKLNVWQAATKFPRSVKNLLFAAQPSLRALKNRAPKKPNGDRTFLLRSPYHLALATLKPPKLAVMNLLLLRLYCAKSAWQTARTFWSMSLMVSIRWKPSRVLAGAPFPAVIIPSEASAIS